MTDPTPFVLSDDHREVDLLLADALENLRLGNGLEAFQALDLFWARLAMHIRAEHLHLFPAVLNTSHPDSEVPQTLEALRRDHDFFMHELADAIKAMRAMNTANEADVMRDALNSVEAIERRLVEHNAIEEETVYPLQVSLPAAESEKLLRSIDKEIQNLPPRLRPTG